MTTKTFNATIYLAGELTTIKQGCRIFCSAGTACVTVTPTEFVYNGCSETGAAVGFINYARFPADPRIIKEKARELAVQLMACCCQRSCSIVFSDETEYLQNAAIKI